ncbi:BppU family phage baseplate upper protein [Bacillus thuringiensis]|uniref:Phage protein n=1 Tax=Bacillus thuringiensis HD-771 TaxID=1218175 RepID=A0A9W3JEV2_BACTU|nr:BppU family phage baseplate upper protein [Bacillus thuringiensis]AFQ18751.1 Phage protein [Bacillus thuringiensis HD-771]MEB4893623.1 BppU family phage baseplate upper protein [Bacillus thuringiensis]MEC2564126.1 BppU family phage baseplate upper protein [Bacillus thuringiensis]MEC2643302.1 BppU family phage baseplate upper protein [Bacillus thuringiensis]MEC2723437.1 BppU family phage baseplate upper protein [Bacillus thuringiensis]
MRNEEIIIDLADPVFTKTIRSRQNDKNGLKITVYAREKGIKLDLTGYAVKYEATNHTGVFIRDDAQIVDAKNGVFVYTLPSQAVSTSDDWTAYFVFEKSNERMSTPDIRITLRRDVKEGNIKIENYISDFEILKKTIDELQRKLNTMDVVKKSGDTMPGNLLFDRSSTDKTNKIAFSTAGVEELNFYQTGDGYYGIRDVKGDQGVWDYNRNNKTFSVSANTNLVKKAGDIISGVLEFKSDNAIVLGSRSFKTVLHKGAQGALIIAPSTEEQGDGWDWSKRVEIRPDGTIKQATDTDWTTLSTSFGSVGGRPMRYKKVNGIVTITGSVANATNGMTFATLPVGFRPIQDMVFPVQDASVSKSVELTIKGDGGMVLQGLSTNATVHMSATFNI